MFSGSSLIDPWFALTSLRPRASTPPSFGMTGIFLGGFCPASLAVRRDMFELRCDSAFFF